MASSRGHQWQSEVGPECQYACWSWPVFDQNRRGKQGQLFCQALWRLAMMNPTVQTRLQTGPKHPYEACARAFFQLACFTDAPLACLPAQLSPLSRLQAANLPRPDQHNTSSRFKVACGPNPSSGPTRLNHARLSWRVLAKLNLLPGPA
eukprot:433271-Pleurochrysis_carterae.AAC.1